MNAPLLAPERADDTSDEDCTLGMRGPVLGITRRQYDILLAVAGHDGEPTAGEVLVSCRSIGPAEGAIALMSLVTAGLVHRHDGRYSLSTGGQLAVA